MQTGLQTTGLDAETCRRARLARDRRFDGEFFLAVRTTGIYCRPICPARPPAERNVSYFHSAAQAARAGYRPCLRCRPECAPGSAAWLGSSTTVRRALQLIQQGALNEGRLEELAGRLGVGERYLRKLFQRTLGVSPQAVALNQRLLFAKQLLTETAMPITEVAFAAGFGSVRRFNSTFAEQLQLTPGEVRRRESTSGTGGTLQLQLHYRPPYDWPGVVGFFRRHAVEGMERVTPGSYRRTVRVGDRTGHLVVSHLDNRHALQLELDLPDHRHLMPVIARVRRMFDLDANPAVIDDALGADPALADGVRRTPGVRSPGHWSLFEAAVRAVVGQQVSIDAARTICARLVRASSADAATPAFPDPGALIDLDDCHLPMPERRRKTLRRIAQLFIERGDEPEPAVLAHVPGVGPWTAAMIRLRGSGDPDAFPAGDLGLEQAWESLGSSRAKLADHAAAHWRPWRAYAANLLWRSLSP